MNKQFKLGTEEWAKKVWGLQFLPPNFATDGKKYPVISFFHGRDEYGKAESDLSKLVNQGPMQFAAQLPGFIIIALQWSEWSPTVAAVEYVLNNDPELKDRISARFYTGLSSGGQQTLDAVTTNQELANKISAIVPMSAPGLSNPSGTIYAANAKVKEWIFGVDDTVCNAQVMDSLAKTWNCKRTNLPPTHTGWQAIYNPAWKENGQSIYDFMMASIGTVVVDPPPQKKVAHTLYTDGTWE